MPDRVPRGSIWTLILVDLFARISYGFARTPVLPLYAAFLGAGPAMVGFVGAAATITGIVLKLPSGAISDVVGRRPLLLVGLFVFASGPLAYLFVTEAWGLAGVRFYHGLATAIYSPVAMAAVASLAADRKGEYLSWLSNSKIAGKLLGAFLGGFVLSLALAGGEGSFLAHLKGAFSSEGFDPAGLGKAEFRTAYLVCLAIGGTAFVLGLLVLGRVRQPGLEKKRTLSEAVAKFAKGLREVVSDAKMLLAAGSEGVQNLTVGIVEHFLPIYAVFIAGMTPLQAGYLYGGQILTTIVSKPMFGRFSDRRGRRGVILAGMALCAFPFAAIPWITDFWPLFALSMVFGLGEALVTSSSSAFVGDLARERSMGAAMGVFGTIADTGHALGPILGGAVIAVFAPAGGGVCTAPEPYRIAFGAVAVALLAYSAFFGAATRPGSGGGPASPSCSP